MAVKKIETPLTKSKIASLRAGDEVLLSGVIFTARDAVHKKLHDMIKANKKIPIGLKDTVIYYSGPTPAAPGREAGSCGPTTSSRMDLFTPGLLRLGLSAMIGKGNRSSEVAEAIKKYRAIYFLATGGIGALLSTKVKSAEPILFKELGTEAIHKMEVTDFPLIVGIDSKGNNVYDKVRRKKTGRTAKA